MRYLWLLLFLFAMGGIFAFHRVAVFQAERQGRLMHQELQRQNLHSETAARAEQDVLSRLELKLRDEKEARDAVAQRLRMEEGLRRADSPTAPLRQDVEKQRQVVRELEDELRRLRARRKGASRPRAQASAQTLLDKQNLDEQIRTQNEVVKGLREQWRVLNAQRNIQARVVKSQLDAASDALQQMKTQRQATQNQIKAEQGQAQAQIQQDGARLADEQRDLESRTQEEKDRLAKLNESLALENQNQSAESVAVTNYRAEKDKHDAAIVRLQQEIAQHRRNLAELQQ